MKSLAITDHGNLYGLIGFYKKAREIGVKPLLGCEIYLVIDHSMTEKPERARHRYYHMGLIARNYAGYQHLTKLVTRAHTSGFYYKPRVDLETLAVFAGDLIGFTGCLQGVVPQHLLAGDYEGARDWMGRFVEIFGRENYFVEIQDHELPDQRRIIPDLLKLAEAFDLKVVCTNDVHYVEQSDAETHDALLCIQTNSKVADDNRLKYANDNFYLKTREEMETIFHERPDAVINTAAVAELCELEIPMGESHYPVFKAPPEIQKAGKSNVDYLRDLCKKGLKDRYSIDYDHPEGHEDAAFAHSLVELLDYELKTIENTGFTDYFLIVQEFINWALQKGIPVGPGRGSGAGSLVAYTTRITGVDPIMFKLLFERMLNPERVSPPDFDIDFCMRRRSEVVEYVRNKYGMDCVANIITFGRFGAKMVVRDVARVLDIPYAEADRIAKMVPDDLNMTLELALEKSAELHDEVRTNPLAAKIIDHGRIIEGMVRNTGTHAAGIIIGDRPLEEYIPLTLQDGALTTQYPKAPVEELGLLKMDFLGLKTLTVIADAVESVRRTSDPAFSIEAVPFENAAAFKLLNEARTVGVFQMESAGMRALCRQFGISKIDEIVALIALYRPGPMAWIPDYVRGKKDPATIEYPHPLLEDICKETYGVMVYQEQVMEAAKVIAGYSLGSADILRSAMGKKQSEEMAKQREVFVKGALKTHGIKREKALELFSILEKFAGYGFNKSHSAAYAVLTYQTAYLKANFPVQFMAAVLSSELGNSEKVAHFIDECIAMAVPVLGPDITISRENFTPVLNDEKGNEAQSSIRFGLAAIKGVGDAAATRILEERDANGLYEDFREFAIRMGSQAVNRRVAECLIKSGAFDYSGEDRGAILSDLDGILSEAAARQRDLERGQESFFDLLESAQPGSRGPERAGTGRLNGNGRNGQTVMPLPEKLKNEKELLGFYISGHPLNIFAGLEESLNTFEDSDFSHLPDRTPFRLCGVVSSVTKKISRRDNRPWAIVAFGTKKQIFTVNLYADTYASTATLLIEGEILMISGTLFNRKDDPRLSADRVVPMKQFPSNLVRRVDWVLRCGEESGGFLKELRETVDREHGTTMFRVGFSVGDDLVVFADTASSLTWQVTPDSYRKLRGHAAVIGTLLEVDPPAVSEPSWARRKNGNSA